MKKLIQTILIITISINCNSFGQLPSSPPGTPSQEEPEVLNQGPIHEAFAQPVDLQVQAGLIVPNQPPLDIAENPDEQRPRGSDFIWIPGYWGWDAQRNDFVWVSGCWRLPPVNMSWIPGYWNQVATGWQWVAGFWIANPQAAQIQYLPQPPQLVTVDPPVAIVSDNIWVPECYYWQNGRYILRQGYWLAPQENWVWVPSHYTWTPYGYVFVQGYWDTVLTSRGILYAPVYFPKRFYGSRPSTYALSVVIDTGNLHFSLFSYPHYYHYYFGDYYSESYIKIGIYPWFQFETRHGWYDPIYVHSRWEYRRTVPHWNEHIRQEYDFRRDHRDYRPPRTFRELSSFSPGRDRDRNDFHMVRPIGDYASSKSSHFQFSRMDDREHSGTFGQTTKVNNFRRERMRIETGNDRQHAIQMPRNTKTPALQSRSTLPDRTRYHDEQPGFSQSPAQHGDSHRPESDRNFQRPTAQTSSNIHDRTDDRTRNIQQPDMTPAIPARTEDRTIQQPEMTQIPPMQSTSTIPDRIENRTISTQPSMTETPPLQSEPTLFDRAEDHTGTKQQPGMTQPSPEQATPAGRYRTDDRTRTIQPGSQSPAQPGNAQRPTISDRTNQISSPQMSTSGQTTQRYFPDRSISDRTTQRPSFQTRTLPERKDISRSPVTDRKSGGLFGRSTPSNPESEKGFENGTTRQSPGRHR